jgi:hypothetical protein
MRITLKDRRFSVKSATLSAWIPDLYWSVKYNPNGDHRLSWSLEVEGEPEPDNDMWAVLVYHNKLHFPIRHWQEVLGQVVEWDSAVDDGSGEPNGAFYVLEHEAIHRAKLRFVERDGLKFRFEWSGVCDVFWDEEYESGLPFLAEGWATFTGVTVRGSEADTEESLRNRLAAYLDFRDFEQGPLCRGGTYNDGIGMTQAEFTPISSSVGRGQDP